MKLSLERLLHESAFAIVDLKAEMSFGDYLKPNEEGAVAIARHLSLIEVDGAIVSAGTERSFFDLALCENCTGLIVRDINPRVKAYVDFNVVLLRLSSSLGDYRRMSSELVANRDRALGATSRARRKKSAAESAPILAEYEGAWRAILDEVRHRCEADTEMPADAKAYYLSQVQEFGEIYFQNQSDWRLCEGFDGVRYDVDELMFEKLQSAAKRGQIVATVGDIAQLRFLDDVNIAAIDVSNIVQYTTIKFELNTARNPRVVWTLGPFSKTFYFSYIYAPLSALETAELDALFALWADRGMLRERTKGEDLVRLFSRSRMVRELSGVAETDNAITSIYSKAALAHARELERFLRENSGKRAEFGWMPASE